MSLETIHLLAGEPEEIVTALIRAELYQEDTTLPQVQPVSYQPVPIRTQLRNLFHH